MKKLKKTLAIMVAATIMATFIGCKEDTPAEKAAKDADKVLEETKEIFK
ncbi:MAG: hypothetical protein JRF40_14490 [Deltaproteobacteria bacterium]|nr:hypothetical protein [Deltaproteobacteria bacterium]MBW2220676.1 hypothetical protein [Deltaproteobacteria bacterium]